MSSSCSLLFTVGLQQSARSQRSLQLVAFTRQLIVPPRLNPVRQDATTDYYELTLKKSQVELLSGRQTEIWGYNGIAPGPTIRQRQGRRSVVRVINQLGQDSSSRPINTVLHLHGISAPPHYDGYAADYVPPGYFKDYIYQNDHHAATLWYHDHTMDLTARNVDAGMAGLYIIEDEHEQSLQLPKGEYDVPLILQSKRLTKDGVLVFYNGEPDNLFGDVICVNGVPLPHMDVANRKYRFRLLNGSATRHFLLALSQTVDSLTAGETFTVIASDSGLLREPIAIVTPQQALPLGIAERYEIIVDFSKYPVGSKVFLQMVIQGSNFSGAVKNEATFYPVMRFNVTHEAPDDSVIQATLSEIEPIAITSDLPNRTFTLSRNRRGKWTINGQVWNMQRIDANPQPGAVEVWTFINPDKGRIHPVHLHLADTQLIDRNGSPPRPYERGWKDVFLLGERETIRIAVRFKAGAAYQGKFMMHCHQLVHEDRGMMSQFEVGEGGTDPVTTASPKPIAAMQPL